MGIEEAAVAKVVGGIAKGIGEGVGEGGSHPQPIPRGGESRKIEGVGRKTLNF